MKNMNADSFWAVVDEVKEGRNWESKKRLLTKSLKRLSNSELRNYVICSNYYSSLMCSNHVFCAYYLLSDGFVNDDGWLDFQDSVVLLGKAGYEDVKCMPDNMAHYPFLREFDECSLEAPLREFLSDEEIEGFSESASLYFKTNHIESPDQSMGGSELDDMLTADYCADHFPKLFALSGESTFD